MVYRYIRCLTSTSSPPRCRPGRRWGSQASCRWRKTSLSCFTDFDQKKDVFMGSKKSHSRRTSRSRPMSSLAVTWEIGGDDNKELNAQVQRRPVHPRVRGCLRWSILSTYRVIYQVPNCYKWCKDALYTQVSGLFVNATLSPSSSISCSTISTKNKLKAWYRFLPMIK